MVYTIYLQTLKLLQDHVKLFLLHANCEVDVIVVDYGSTILKYAANVVTSYGSIFLTHKLSIIFEIIALNLNLFKE